MQNITTSVDEYDIVIAEPSTVEEFDKLAKKAGACLQAACRYIRYHDTLGTARDKFAELVEEKYGIKRIAARYEGEGENKKQVSKEESLSTFLARVAAEKKLGPLPFADIAKDISVGGKHEVKTDPSAAERQPGKPPKLPVAYANGAKMVVENKQIAKFAIRYQKATGKALEYNKELTGDALVTEIGWKVREMKLAEEKSAGLSALI